MRILVIGGTGWIGRRLVPELHRLGHSVAVLHRGSTPPDPDPPPHPMVEEILADRRELARLQLRAEVVIDLILSSGAQAAALMAAFRGVAQRVVAASSMDVYRAYGVLMGLEPGPPASVPLTEDSPLRSQLHPYPPAQIAALRPLFGWLDDDYDKIPVERAILGDRELPGTVVRLPMLYGPEDRMRRLQPLVRRMDDGRRAILVAAEWAGWRPPRGYIDNAAAALALAAVSPQAAGRVYNFAETPPIAELDWAHRVAAAAGWQGRFVVLPAARMPAPLAPPGNSAQDLAADSARIRAELGYREPTPLDAAIARTIAWERSLSPAHPSVNPFDYPAEDAAELAAENDAAETPSPVTQGG